MSDEGLHSRLCAVNALAAVFDGQNPFDQSLDKFAKKYDLSPQDKSFAHALCAFVLRYKIPLQSLINKAANRNKDITPTHLNILLLVGAAQIFLMNVPDHAAVDTSVEIAAKIKCNKQKGLVNAVLRRLLREGKPTDFSPSLPRWLKQSWVKDYGVELADDLEYASLTEAKTGIVNKDGVWALHDGTDAITLTPNEWVQDFSSHLPVSLLGDIAGKRVFDLCAAPGGKTMQLAAKGAKVTAVDISEKRLNRLHENLQRTNLGDNVEIVCADILKWKPSDKADIILLDAPCSATGTIRRHPDLPYIRGADDVHSLVALQDKLLSLTASWLKPNGVLVYCTCSLQKDEGERQIDKFLTNNPKFKRVVITDYKEWQTLQGDVRLLPTYGDMDGFFISILSYNTD